MNDCELYQELISRLVDGQLNRSEYAALDAHMENCAECSAMYAVFASLSDIIGSEDEPLPEDLHENIMAGVRRSAMINRNKRRLSRPVRNSLAAVACAALVLFAARGLSPAEKAESTVITQSEAAAMDMQRQADTAEAPKEIFVDTPTEAAPATTQAPAPVATPVPTEDIYLGGGEEEEDAYAYTAATPPVYTQTPVIQTPAPTPAPTPIVVQTPAPTPAPVQEAAPAPAAEPAPVNEEAVTAAPAAMDEGTETEQIAAYSFEESTEENSLPAPEAAPAAEPEAASAPAAAEPEATASAPVTAEPEPVPTETPKLHNRIFAFFGLARPEAAPEAEAAPEMAAAGPVATEAPAEEAQPEASPAIEEAAEEAEEEDEEKKKALPPVIMLETEKKLVALEELIDGEEKELPKDEAEKVYVFRLEKPEEMFKDYKIKVFVYEKEVYYEQFFAENDSIVCLAGCTVEEFEKFMETLTEKEKAALIPPSPSPSLAPGETLPPLASPTLSSDINPAETAK